MRNRDIADAFAELADRLALTDLKPYRWMAYRRAAETFRELPESIELLRQHGRLRDIEGVGDAIEEKVQSLLDTGTFPALEQARADVSDTLLALTRLPGIGPATARKIFAATDQLPYESLLQRAGAGSLTPGGGLTAKHIAQLADAAARQTAEPGGEWFRRDQVEAVHRALAELVPSMHFEPVGPWARGCELLQEALLIAPAPEPAAAAGSLRNAATGRGWEHADGSASPSAELLAAVAPLPLAAVHLLSPTGVPSTVACVTPREEPQARHVLCGPPAWVVREPAPTPGSIAVELRDAVLDGRLSIEQARIDLIEAADLRGELHAHSTWSDGKASILEMARAARDRGDSYFCITDHSAPYAMVNGLDPSRVHAQGEEVARVNEQLAREHDEMGTPTLRVLRGIELEILADGTLGLPDATLAQLDWVVASIHSQQRQAADVILERMRCVVANPLVDAIGHPTSRRLLIRDRTALDVAALIELARENEVVLEINANPERLDLDSEHAAAAIAAGVRLTINTDAHRTSTLAHRDHGIAVARRAGVRARDVVNCLSVDELVAQRRRA